MAVAIQAMSVASGLKLVRDADADGTGENDVDGGACTLWLVLIDNTGNDSDRVYLKLYDHASPTIGTTVNNMSIPASAGQTVTMAILPAGLAFATALSFACVTNGGGTAGTTDPTNAVAVALVIS